MRLFRAPFLVVVAAVSAAIVLGSTRVARVGFGVWPKPSLRHFPAPFLQCSRVPSPMEDRQNPNLLFSNNVIDAIELEAMDRRAAHVGKSNSMEQRRFA